LLADEFRLRHFFALVYALLPFHCRYVLLPRGCYALFRYAALPDRQLYYCWRLCCALLLMLTFFHMLYDHHNNISAFAFRFTVIRYDIDSSLAIYATLHTRLLA